MNIFINPKSIKSIHYCFTQLFKWLNKLGLCRSVTTTRAVIYRLCDDFDKEIKLWKDDIQVHVLLMRIPVRNGFSIHVK